MDKDEVLKKAIECPRCIISVMGDHAGEGVNEIFIRKIADIRRVGYTFWLMKLSKAQFAQVQEMFETTPGYVIFVEPAWILI